MYRLTVGFVLLTIIITTVFANQKAKDEKGETVYMFSSTIPKGIDRSMEIRNMTDNNGYFSEYNFNISFHFRTCMSFSELLRISSKSWYYDENNQPILKAIIYNRNLVLNINSLESVQLQLTVSDFEWYSFRLSASLSGEAGIINVYIECCKIDTSKCVRQEFNPFLSDFPGFKVMIGLIAGTPIPRFAGCIKQITFNEGLDFNIDTNYSFGRIQIAKDCNMTCSDQGTTLNIKNCIKSTGIIPLVPRQLIKFADGTLYVSKYDILFKRSLLEYDVDQANLQFPKDFRRNGSIAPEIGRNLDLVLKSLNPDDGGLYFTGVLIRRNAKQESEFHKYSAFFDVQDPCFEEVNRSKSDICEVKRCLTSAEGYVTYNGGILPELSVNVCTKEQEGEYSCCNRMTNECISEFISLWKKETDTTLPFLVAILILYIIILIAV